MSERVRVMRPVPTSEDLRRKLEGGLELIEVTSRHYQLLEDVLRREDWRHWLRVQPRFVNGVLERDAACLEALERATRRAQREGWPEDSSVFEPLREAKQSRERLVAQVRARLAPQRAASEESSLESDLRRLDTLAREPVPPEKLPAEVFRAPGGAVVANELVVPLASLPILVTAIVGLWVGTPLWVQVPAVLLALAVNVVGVWRLRNGFVTLAPERVALESSGWDPLAVRLDSIREGGIVLDSERRKLRVEGDRVLHVRLGPSDAERLRAGLEVFRHPELRARRRLEAPPGAQVGFPTLLRGGTGQQSGQAVLTRRGLFFLPGTVEEAGAALLKAATGRSLDSRVQLSWVQEALRWQPESDVDAYLLQAAEASGGVAWPAEQLRHSGDLPLSAGAPITFEHEAGSLTGQFQGENLVYVDRILADWAEALCFLPAGERA